MLSNDLWNKLVKATNYLQDYVGKKFFSKKHNCEVEIIYYTLCGQLFYRDKEHKVNDYIMREEFEQGMY